MVDRLTISPKNFPEDLKMISKNFLTFRYFPCDLFDGSSWSWILNPWHKQINKMFQTSMKASDIRIHYAWYDYINTCISWKRVDRSIVCLSVLLVKASFYGFYSIKLSFFIHSFANLYKTSGHIPQYNEEGESAALGKLIIALAKFYNYDAPTTTTMTTRSCIMGKVLSSKVIGKKGLPYEFPLYLFLLLIVRLNGI